MAQIVIQDRWYQTEAEAAVFQYFYDGNTGNPIVAMPTGTGKSVVIARILRTIFSNWPTQRVMMLTHVKELIQQNYDKLMAVWPTAPAGVFSAGLKRKEHWYPITFGGIGSVGKKGQLFGHIDLLLVDECHLISNKENTLYMKFIEFLKKVNPNLKVIGFTATPYRLGMGLLTEAEGGIFTHICYDITGVEAFNRLIREGYLSPLRPKKTRFEQQIEGVGLVGGEFNQKQLEQAVGSYEKTKEALLETIYFGQNRHKWLIFCAGVAHCMTASSILEELGVSHVVIHSDMSEDDRDKAVEDFKAGKYQAAINNNVLTTGFDDPMIDLIAVLRPTQSPGLWVQMLGRGTRPVYAPGYDLNTTEGRLKAIEAGPKQDCLVLDFARNTARLGPINDPKIPKAKGRKGGGTAPVRVCPECDTYNPASARFCCNCGQEFPRELKIIASASTEALIREEAEFQPAYEVFRVDKVIYEVHEKEGRPDSIRATYMCGMRRFRSYICLEHEGYASKKARDWWREASNGLEPPPNTAAAMLCLGDLREPTSIRVMLSNGGRNGDVMEVFYA